MYTNTNSRRALKLAQEQEVAEDWRREVMLGTLLKLLVKDKLLHSGKVPVNAKEQQLRPLRREKRGYSR